MTKIAYRAGEITGYIAYRAGEFIGMQIVTFFSGMVVATIAHGMFGLDAEPAAEMVVVAQSFVAGFTIRGWL